jgi:2-keto-4-pentenoate hydratase/2-oxohepta-3-ene-1,7-dioic acid hydratase in catechol pathway
MKLASFRAGERDCIGFALPDGSMGDIESALRMLDADARPRDMMDLVRGGAHVVDRLRRAWEAAVAGPEQVARFDAAQVSWHPPVRAPSKIVCLALNNRALDAIKIRAPTDHPAFFLKPSTALIGHLDAIRLRPAYGLTHPEPELAVVIGQALKDASPSRAMEAVFGYTIMNDITSVGMREEDSFSVRYYKLGETAGAVAVGVAHTTYPGRYKASDTFAPLGPYLVTRDEICDPMDLKIQCTMGDKLIASDHTRNYVWSVADALSHISRTMTLLPGDVVSMGTAVGGDHDDSRSPEVPGVTKMNLIDYDGRVSVTITGLGTLSNTIRMI